MTREEREKFIQEAIVNGSLTMRSVKDVAKEIAEKWEKELEELEEALY